jgi:HK97 family phage major capsid protein
MNDVHSLDALGESIDQRFRRSDDMLNKTVQGHNERVGAWRTDHARLNDHEGRFESLEAKIDRPRGGGDGDGRRRFSREDDEHKSVFLEWIRRPTDDRCKARLAEAQHAMSRKDVLLATPSAGGYGLPKEISSDIETRVRQLNPFRGLVDTVTVSTSDFHSLVSMGDGTSGWSSETGTRTATASPTLRDVAPTFGEQYALPTASNWSLQDIFFDVQNWLVQDVAADFAANEATAIISGTGSSQPTGILHTTPTATADYASPMRPQDCIQFVPLTGAGSPLRLTIDTLIDLVGSVREKYIQETDRCAFVMHRLTLAGLRKAKASTAGVYLWEPDSQAGVPPNILGYRVLTCDAMPSNTAGSFSVLFGNWRRGYILCDRVGMSIVVDPYTTPGMTRFYVSRRIGGRTRNNDAIKAVKNA